MLSYPEVTRRSHFRMLVGLIFISLAQDTLWLLFNNDVADDDDDGGVERTVKQISRNVSWVSFFWRIVLALILWKDSLDFITVIKEVHIDGDGLSLEERVADIIKEHQAEFGSEHRRSPSQSMDQSDQFRQARHGIE